ncbi:10003_t:CDS:10 [Entrophospora sp. SA101]|nr:10003_t:CDS:10 [Entrophospora sp. SA101]
MDEGKFVEETKFSGSSIFDIIINPTFALETTINYVELINNNLKVVDGINYQDGTILLRLLDPLKYCNESTVYLRLVHTNRTITTLDLNNLNIPRENFCYNPTLVANSKQSSGSSSGDSITINAIAYKYILINYFCDHSISNKVCGDVITWTGELVSTIEFENVCNDSRIIQSHKKDDGFLRVCYVEDEKEIIWTKYSVPNIATGTIIETSTGKLTDISNFNPNITNFFSREDGSYAMVTCTTSTKTTTDSNQFTGDWTISVTFLSVDNNPQQTGPFELYKTKTSSSGLIDIVNIHRCDLAYYFSGYSCLITIVRSTNISYIDIDFTSSGKLNSLTPEFSIAQISNTTTTTIWDVQPLYYGGYVILVEAAPTGNVEGHICSNNGTYFGNWGFSGQYEYTNKIAGVLPDNTLWTIPKQPTGNCSWTCLLTDTLTTYSTVQSNNISFSIIGKFPGGPGGYGSDSILSTIPEKNSSIISANTDSITISYTKPVTKSSGNVNIYQIRSSTDTSINNSDDYYDESEDVLRQSCSGQSDYVQILGTEGSIKNFVVRDELYVNYDSSSVSCIIRLTPEGTTYYISLSKNDQLDFVGKLSNELSNALPCDATRIKIPTKFQYSHDNNNNYSSINDNLTFKNYEMNITASSTDQIFMRVNIEGTLSRTELSAIQLSSDLNELIINKNVTLLSKGLYTNLIDSGYGAEQIAMGTRKYKLAQNLLAITMFIFITIDFCLDIAFVSIHGKDFKWLYLPRTEASEVSDTPTTSSYSSSFTSREKLLTSFNSYNKLILIGRMFSFMVEDSAHLFILILYREFSITPAIIPMLSFSAATTVLILKSMLIILGIYLNSFGSIIVDSSDRDEYDDRKSVLDNVKEKNGSGRRKKSSSMSRKGSKDIYDDTYSSSGGKKKRNNKSSNEERRSALSMFDVDEDNKKSTKSRSVNKEKNIAPVVTDNIDNTNDANVLFSSSPILSDTQAPNIDNDLKSGELKAAIGKNIDDNDSSDSQKPEDDDYGKQDESASIYKNITSGILETDKVDTSSTGVRYEYLKLENERTEFTTGFINIVSQITIEMTYFQQDTKMDLDQNPIMVLSEIRKVIPIELQEYLNIFEDLYDRKLWHQLTLKMEEFFSEQDSGPFQIPLFRYFISDWENKMNKLKLVTLGLSVLKQFGDYNQALEFLTSLVEKVNSPETHDAYVLAVMETAYIKLMLNDLEGTKSAIDECEKILDSFDSVETIIHASYYRVCAEFYKVKAEYAEYYKSALLYLACIQLDDLKPEEKVQRAYLLAISALLSDSIYNFGELKVHPILNSLENTTYEWLKNLLIAFNAGDIGKFEMLSVNFSQEVEYLVMKALSLKLIRGSIDQVGEVVVVTWVQPRALELEQIDNMRQRLQEWDENVKKTALAVENETPELFLTLVFKN